MRHIPPLALTVNQGERLALQLPPAHARPGKCAAIRELLCETARAVLGAFEAPLRQWLAIDARVPHARLDDACLADLGFARECGT